MKSAKEPSSVMGQSDTTEEGVIHIDSVTMKYDGSVLALDDVSIEIFEGEFFTLLGPSGSGKSTLLKIIGGFEKPTQGTVRINNRDVTNTRPQDRPVSMVFQEYALFPHMTVKENVKYGLDVAGTGDDRKEELVTQYLEMLSIPELEDRQPSQLSGGQRQRVALARSLVVEPDILLLDEPLGPLDEDLRRQMQFELKSLQDRIGTTFVYVTHDQEEALTMSDRICLLNEGRIIESGPTEQIYEWPTSRFTATFIGAGNVIDGVVNSVDGNHIGMQIEQDGSIINGLTAIDDLKEGQSVSATVRPADITVGNSQLETNVVSGEIKRWVYKGKKYEYVIELDNGVEIQAISEELFDQTEDDNRVTISWTEDDCIIVTR